MLGFKPCRVGFAGFHVYGLSWSILRPERFTPGHEFGSVLCRLRVVKGSKFRGFWLRFSENQLHSEPEAQAWSLSAAPWETN